MPQWENLTSADFKKELIRSKRTCVLPVAVIEKHGEQLPLGTDMMTAYVVSCLAAEKERAVVFPWYYFGQVMESKLHPGAIAIETGLMLELLRNVCDEIGRNGFKKIIIINGHGGDPALIELLCRSMLNKKKDYVIYYPPDYYNDPWDKLNTTKLTNGHAGHMETSIMLAINKHLVKMNRIGRPFPSLERLKHLGNMRTPVSFYANYPDQYTGDATRASEALGRKMLEASVDYVADVIRKVKKDRATHKLYSQFFKTANF